MYYLAPETPMMSSVIADCPELVPPQYFGQVYASGLLQQTSYVTPEKVPFLQSVLSASARVIAQISLALVMSLFLLRVRVTAVQSIHSLQSPLSCFQNAARQCKWCLSDYMRKP